MCIRDSNTIDSRTEELGRVMTDRAERVTQTLAVRATEINEILGEKAIEIAHTFDNQVRHFEDNIVTRLETIGSVIGDQSHAFGTSLENKTQAISDALDTAIVRLSTTLDSQGTELVSSLQSHAVAISDTIARVGNNAANSLNGTTERLQSETLVTLQKLADASRIVQNVVESANIAISDLESKLADRVIGLSHAGAVIKDEATHSANLLLEQIEAMRSVTGAGIYETRALVDLLDERTRAVSAVTREHVSMLETAANTLGGIEGRLGSDLENRKATIEVLTNALNTHFQDVESVANNFARHLNDALYAIENRAESIKSIMSDAAEVASQTLRDRFNTVRAEADLEKNRTVESVRIMSSETLSLIHI